MFFLLAMMSLWKPASIVIYNEDSDNAFRACYHADTERYADDEFARYLEEVIGPGKVTHFFMCVNSRVANFPSRTVSPYWTCLDDPKMTHPAFLKAMRDYFVVQGRDHLALWLGMCRKKGVSPWVSVRMNDVHCVYDDTFFANVGFWKEHPEFWCVPHAKGGPWEYRALDYSHKDVRDWMLAFVREVLERYDVDGIELDWMRWVRHLPPGRERELSHHLDEMTREVRRVVNEMQIRRGHPIRIAARVDSDPVAALNHGTDYRVWTRERLIDWLIPCNFFNTADFELPYAKWAKEVAALNPAVTVIPGLDCNVTLSGKRRGLTAAEYCGWGERMYNQGAPGAYFFNLFAFYPHRSQPSADSPWQVIVRDGFTRDVIRRHAKSIPADATRECAKWLK